MKCMVRRGMNAFIIFYPTASWSRFKVRTAGVHLPQSVTRSLAALVSRKPGQEMEDLIIALSMHWVRMSEDCKGRVTHFVSWCRSYGIAPAPWYDTHSMTSWDHSVHIHKHEPMSWRLFESHSVEADIFLDVFGYHWKCDQVLLDRAAPWLHDHPSKLSGEFLQRTVENGGLACYGELLTAWTFHEAANPQHNRLQSGQRHCKVVTERTN